MKKLKKSPSLKAKTPKLKAKTPKLKVKTLKMRRINSINKGRSPFKSKPLKMKIFNKNNEKFISPSSKKPVKARRLKTLPQTKRLKTMPDI